MANVTYMTNTKNHGVQNVLLYSSDDESPGNAKSAWLDFSNMPCGNPKWGDTDVQQGNATFLTMRVTVLSGKILEEKRQI